MRSMKRYLSLFFALLLVLTVLPLNEIAWADGEPEPLNGLSNDSYLGYQFLKGGEDGFHEPSGDIYIRTSLADSKGSDYGVLFMFCEYDSDEDKWVYSPVERGALTVSDPPVVEIEQMLEKDVDEEGGPTQYKDHYVWIRLLDWGKGYISYTHGSGEDAPEYQLPVSVVLPELGFYKEAEATEENYIDAFKYTKDARAFYMIANFEGIVLGENPSFDLNVRSGEDKVDIEETGKKEVYKVTVKEDVQGDFPLFIELVVKVDEHENWERNCFMLLSEAEEDGLVVTWPDWKEAPDSYSHYPVLRDEGERFYSSNADMEIGNSTFAFFFRYQKVEDGDWTYLPIAADQLSVVSESGEELSDSGIELSAWSDPEAGTAPGEDESHTGPEDSNYHFTEIDAEVFGKFAIRYTVESNGTTKDYDLPLTVNLPQVGFYKEAVANEGNYIGEFKYTDDNRVFYMIAEPGSHAEEGMELEYDIHEGGGNVEISPVDGKDDTYKVEIKKGAEEAFRLRVEFKDIEDSEHRWSRQGEIYIREAEQEGLAVTWPDWKKAPDSHSHYPVLKDEEERFYSSNADMEIGNSTFAFFFRYQKVEDGDWTYLPIAADQLSVVSESGEELSDSGIELSAWSDPEAGASPGEDESHTGPEGSRYHFTEIDAEVFGSFKIRYTVDSNGGSEYYDLPLTVSLPQVGFYKEAVASEDNYIGEFKYTGESRVFYLIAEPDFHAEEGAVLELKYEIHEGAENIDLSPVGEKDDTYKVEIKKGAQEEFRLRVRFKIMEDEQERWSSERDIHIREADQEGLVYRDLDWAGGGDDGGHYEKADQEYRTRLDTDPQDKVAIFYKKYKKEGDGEDDWSYTPVAPDDIDFDNQYVTLSELDPNDIYSGDEGFDTTNSQHYRRISFKQLGNFTLEYNDGDKTYSLSVNVDLPRLGAYKHTEGGLEHWLSEVDILEHRSIYLLPGPDVDLGDVDLEESEFKVYREGDHDGQSMEYKSATGSIPERLVLLEGDKEVGLIIKPVREPGNGNPDKITHFEVSILYTPFDKEFQVRYRIKDSDGHELIHDDVRFRTFPEHVQSVENGENLATPTVGTSIEAEAAVLSECVKYYSFTAGNLAEDEAYLFTLRDRDGKEIHQAKLFVFDEGWRLIDETSWENLADDNKSITMGQSSLISDQTYYLAIFNKDSADHNFELTASVATLPRKPEFEHMRDGWTGAHGFEASGASEGDQYEIYAFVDGKWRPRGRREYQEDMPNAHWNIYDVVMDGETATKFKAVISAGGLEGPSSDQLEMTVTRQDENTEGYVIEVLHYPESKLLMLTLDEEQAGDPVFELGRYYRLRYEKLDHSGDFHSDFIGDGKRSVLCQAHSHGPVELENEADGMYTISAYRESPDGDKLTIGWDYLVNYRIEGGSETGRGKFNYDRPDAWLSIGEEYHDYNFPGDQKFPGQPLVSYTIRDERTKFYFVEYDSQASGDKFTISGPIGAESLIPTGGLTLKDASGDNGDGGGNDDFVELSFASWGDYEVSYNKDGKTYTAKIYSGQGEIDWYADPRASWENCFQGAIPNLAGSFYLVWTQQFERNHDWTLSENIADSVEIETYEYYGELQDGDGYQDFYIRDRYGAFIKATDDERTFYYRKNDPTDPNDSPPVTFSAVADEKAIAFNIRQDDDGIYASDFSVIVKLKGAGDHMARDLMVDVEKFADIWSAGTDTLKMEVMPEYEGYQFGVAKTDDATTMATTATVAFDDGDQGERAVFTGLEAGTTYYVYYRQDESLPWTLASGIFATTESEPSIEYVLDQTENEVEITLKAVELSEKAGQDVHMIYAIYKAGRMVGLVQKEIQLGEGGYVFTEIVPYTSAAIPDTCKVFVIDQGSCAPVVENYKCSVQ